MNTINGVEITAENFIENSALATQVSLLLFGAEMDINGVIYREDQYDDAVAKLEEIGYKFS